MSCSKNDMIFWINISAWFLVHMTSGVGVILGMSSTNKRQHYIVRLSLIDWVHTHDDTNPSYCCGHSIIRHDMGTTLHIYMTSTHVSDLPSDAIWRHRSGSTLAQVMACCLTAPSHYLNQCWLIISEVLWHSPEGNFTWNAQDIYPWPLRLHPHLPGTNELIDYVTLMTMTVFIIMVSWLLSYVTITYLTHWSSVVHICISKITIIGSDNGLSLGRRQAIIWTNVRILWIGSLGTNFSEILIEIFKFSLKKMHLKMSSGKWQPSCLNLTGSHRYPGSTSSSNKTASFQKEAMGTQVAL